MNAARTYYAQNSGTVNYVIYGIVAVVIIYYGYQLYATPSTDLILSSVKTDANKVTTATISSGALPAIRSGGAYTLTLWTYINSYEYRAGRPKRMFTILDSKTPHRALAVGILYPTEPKLMIRFATTHPPGTDYTNLDTLHQYLAGARIASPDSNPIELPSCDLHEIDLQRWVCLTISVNGRIVDVYMDGKLTRSCVLSDLPVAGQDGHQQITFGGPDGFSGYFGSVQFSGLALSPDKIYSIYQEGPYPGADPGFLGFLTAKLGIKIQ